MRLELHDYIDKGSMNGLSPYSKQIDDPEARHAGCSKIEAHKGMAKENLQRKNYGLSIALKFLMHVTLVSEDDLI